MKKLNVLFISLLLLIVGSLYSEDMKYHGADSVIVINDVAVFWAVLKVPDVDKSNVYISIVPLDLSELRFTHYSVVASNVFTEEEEIIIDFKLLENENLIIQNYKDFKNMSKRRLLFYNSENSRSDPSMEIYYMSIPDTSPEFLKEEHIQGFFDHSLKMINK